MTQINLTRPDLLRDACYIGGEWSAPAMARPFP